MPSKMGFSTSSNVSVAAFTIQFQALAKKPKTGLIPFSHILTAHVPIPENTIFRMSHVHRDAVLIHSQAVMMPLRNQSTLFQAQISAVTRAAIPATHKPTGLAAIEIFSAFIALSTFTTTV